MNTDITKKGNDYRVQWLWSKIRFDIAKKLKKTRSCLQEQMVHI